MAGSSVCIASSDKVGSGKAFFNDAVTTAVQVKGTAGQVYMIDVVNTTAAAAYLQIFFKPLTAVTLGTTAPDCVIRLLASVGKTIVFTVPIGFPPAASAATQGSGLTIAGTTTPTGSTTAALSVAAVYM